MKRAISITALTLLILLIIGTGAYVALTKPKTANIGSSVKNNADSALPQREESIWIAYKDGGADPEVYAAFEQDLLNLFYDYRDAMLLTQALLHLKLEETEQIDFDTIFKQSILAWDKVEADVDKVTSYNNNTETSWVWDWFHIKLQEHRPFVPAVLAYGEGEETEVGLKFAGFDQVDYLKERMPSIDEELVIQSEFGGTAKEVKEKLIEYHSYTAENWNDWVKIHDFGSKTATSIELSSKVALFVGGAVISGGGTLAASVGVVDGTLLTISGADLVCDLGQGSAALGFTDPSTGETFAIVQDKMGPLTFIANVADASNYAENAGGAVNAVYGLANVASSGLDIQVENGGMNITPKRREDIRIPETNADGIVSDYFPPGMAYDVGLTPQAMKEEEENRIAAQEEIERLADEAESAAAAFVGPYTGTINATIPGTGQNISIPVVVLVGYEDVRMKISDSQTKAYGTAGYSISMEYKFGGELNGKLNSNKQGFNLSGSFTSEARTIVPADVAKYMPPEAFSALNTVNNGTATADGTISTDGKSLNGTITFAGSQATIVAAYGAAHDVEYSE